MVGWLDGLFVIGVFVFTASAAWCDFRMKKLPNALTMPALAMGVAFAVTQGVVLGGWSGAIHGLSFALGGFATGFCILLVLWLIGGGGGGDVKFMGALGAWLGASMTLQVLVVSAVLAGAISVGLLVVQAIRTGFGRVQRRYRAETQSHVSRKRQVSERERQERAVRRRLMPFAVPAALATWSVLIVTHVVFK